MEHTPSFNDVRDPRGPAPPVNLVNVNGEPIELDLAGVALVRQLRDCVAEHFCVMPEEVRLVCKSIGVVDLLDTKNIAGYLKSEKALLVQVVITDGRESKGLQKDLLGSLGVGGDFKKLATKHQLVVPFREPGPPEHMMDFCRPPPTPMTRLPEAIADSHELRLIDFSDHQLRYLPEHFGKLTKLTMLTLSRNVLKKLPDSFGGLVHLKHLLLDDNKLKGLPESFGSLPNLKKLHLNNNRLVQLPATFPKLSKLVHLDLKTNRLSSLPNNFAELRHLADLEIRDNQIVSLPEGFERLRLSTFGFDFENVDEDSRREFVSRLPNTYRNQPRCKPYKQAYQCCPWRKKSKQETMAWLHPEGHVEEDEPDIEEDAHVEYSLDFLRSSSDGHLTRGSSAKLDLETKNELTVAGSSAGELDSVSAAGRVGVLADAYIEEASERFLAENHVDDEPCFLDDWTLLGQSR